jgi:hypothetical protein
MACLVWRICVFDSSFSRFSSKVTGATKRRSEKIEAFDMILVFLHKLEKKQKQIGSYGVWQSSATIQTSHQSCTGPRLVKQDFFLVQEKVCLLARIVSSHEQNGFVGYNSSGVSELNWAPRL